MKTVGFLWLCYLFPCSWLSCQGLCTKTTWKQLFFYDCCLFPCSWLSCQGLCTKTTWKQLVSYDCVICFLVLVCLVRGCVLKQHENSWFLMTVLFAFLFLLSCQGLCTKTTWKQLVSYDCVICFLVLGCLVRGCVLKQHENSWFLMTVLFAFLFMAVLSGAVCSSWWNYIKEYIIASLLLWFYQIRMLAVAKCGTVFCFLCNGQSFCCFADCVWRHPRVQLLWWYRHWWRERDHWQLSIM